MFENNNNNNNNNNYYYYYFFSLGAITPLVGLGLLIHEDFSRPYTTHHSR